MTLYANPNNLIDPSTKEKTKIQFFEVNLIFYTIIYYKIISQGGEKKLS